MRAQHATFATSGAASAVLLMCILLFSSSVVSTVNTGASIGSGVIGSPTVKPSDLIPPLDAMIVDEAYNSVETLTVNVDQLFTLIGLASGGYIPYFYVWKDGDLILSTSYILTTSFSTDGTYLITMIVRDMMDQEASDSCTITVLPVAPPEPTLDDLINDLVALVSGSATADWARAKQKAKMLGMIDNMRNLADADAYAMLLHAIKPKLTGLKTDAGEVSWGNGILRHPWVVSPVLQEDCRVAVNAILLKLLEQMTPEPLVNSINNLVGLLQSSATADWAKAHQQASMLNKVNDVRSLAPSIAYDKVLRDIKPKLTGLKTDASEVPWGNGICRHPWVVNSVLQENCRVAVNALLTALLGLM